MLIQSYFYLYYFDINFDCIRHIDIEYVTTFLSIRNKLVFKNKRIKVFQNHSRNLGPQKVFYKEK